MKRRRLCVFGDEAPAGPRPDSIQPPTQSNPRDSHGLTPDDGQPITAANYDFDFRSRIVYHQQAASNAASVVGAAMDQAVTVSK